MNDYERVRKMEEAMNGPLWQSSDSSKPMSYQRAQQVAEYRKIKSKLRGGGNAGRGDVPHKFGMSYGPGDGDPTPPHGIPRPQL